MQEGITDKELKWLIDRSKLITSSSMSKLFQGGRKKSDVFGKVAIDYIDDIVYQIQSGNLIDQLKGYSLEWGKDNEPLCFEWLKDNYEGMYDIKNCANDFDEITFRTVGNFLGDSLDGLVFDGNTEIAWIESKCPSNSKKAWKLTNKKSITKTDVVNEYRYQLACHFLASPHIDEGWYVIYDGHYNIDGTWRNKGRVFKYYRKEFTELINECKDRARKVHEFILLCANEEYEPCDINAWWKLKEYEV